MFLFLRNLAAGKLSCLLLGCFFLFSSQGFAASNPEAAQQAGIAAAKAGHYQQALSHFLNAQKGGLENAALNYNLAVSYYRLGKYPQAKKRFLILAKKPDSRQLAYFNLGLVANRQNREAEAIKWFQRAYTTTGSERLQAMSREALRRLGSKPESAYSWFGFVSSNFLYDSNVTLANDALTGISGTADNAVQVIGSGSGWLTGNRHNGVRLSVGAYLQQYKTLGTNDFSQLNVALGQYNKWQNWYTKVYLRLEDSYFGGANYQRAASLDNRARWTLTNTQWLTVRYKVSWLQATNTRFDYLDGQRHQVRLGTLVRKKRYSVTGYYQLELNDRQDRVSPSGRFTSFTPTRHLLRSRMNINFRPRWRINLDASYRNSVYRGVNALSDGSKMRRIDQQYRATIGLNRRLSARWELGTRYSFTRNDSSINLYRYRRYQITAGLSGTF